jgi:hypothetical protein
VLFANLNLWIGIFALVTGLALWLLPKFAAWFFRLVVK